MDAWDPFHRPQFTVCQVWLGSILGLSVLTRQGFVSPAKLIFLPLKIALEPWRLVTLFIYFGELLVSLIQAVAAITRTVRTLESTYVLKMDALPRRLTAQLDDTLREALQREMDLWKAANFAHFVLRIYMSVIFTVLLSARLFDTASASMVLGPSLTRIMLYILYRIAPDENLFFLGLFIKARYAPFVSTVLEFLLSDDFRIVRAFMKVSRSQALYRFATSTFVMQTVWIFSIGHMWWFVQFFYIDELYNEHGDPRQSQLNAAYNRLNPNDAVFSLPELFRYVLTPPWYYYLVKNIKAAQLARAQMPVTDEPETPVVNDLDNDIEQIDPSPGATGVDSTGSEAAGSTARERPNTDPGLTEA